MPDHFQRYARTVAYSSCYSTTKRPARLYTTGRPWSLQILWLFSLRHQGGKCPRVTNGEIRQHLAVEIDIGFLERRDQLAVGGAVQTGGGIDAGNPQLTQIALAHAAITGGVPQALQHGLIGPLEQAVLG